MECDAMWKIVVKVYGKSKFHRKTKPKKFKLWQTFTGKHLEKYEVWVICQWKMPAGNPNLESFGQLTELLIN